MREESGIAKNVLSLPSGGGALSPLGERFQPDLFRGTGNYSVPIQLPEGPAGVRPQLALSYSTGAGNGPFGVGWRLSPLRIERRTDRGIPTYFSGQDSFSIGDAEVLVPMGGGRYRPQVDTQFWDIREHEGGWRIRFGDGREAVLGVSNDSREFDGSRVFAWFVEEERDQAGNIISYSYKRNRGRLYLRSIQYSIYELKFIYEKRPDVLHDGRAGFPRYTALRCRSIEVHCSRLTPTIIQRYELGYREAEGSKLSLLNSIVLRGFGEDGAEKTFPVLSFDYTIFDATARRYDVLYAEAVPPPSLGMPNVQLVDMTADGLPDVLVSHQGFHRYWRNLGHGHFGGPYRIDDIPSTLHLANNNVAFADIDGDGVADLFTVDGAFSFAFRGNGEGGWDDRPILFGERVDIQLAARDTRLMDLNGDGLVDLLRTGGSHLVLHYNMGEAGWSLPQTVGRVPDLDLFPDVSFADRSVRLADMTGDGLQDIVFVASGRAEYWPYYGHGRWGNRVRMAGAPAFPQGYRQDRLLLLDINGNGCADLVYVDLDRVYYWLNQSGLRFSQQYEIPFVPAPDLQSLQPADMWGTGTCGLVWSKSANGMGRTNYQYLDFTGGVKPYLLSRIDNGLGGITTIKYSTSTEMRLRDEAEGDPWDTFLPFPVQVVAEICEHDTTTSRDRIISLRYHKGVYDGRNREFRGFGQVAMDTIGDDSVPTVRQVNEFYQDADGESSPELTRALAGAPKRIGIYEEKGNAFLLKQIAVQHWEARLEYDNSDEKVYFPYVRSIETRELGTPTKVEQVRFEYDVHGNQNVRERQSLAEGAPESEWIVTREDFSYISLEDKWLIKLPIRSELRDRSGVVQAAQIRYYDGPAFQGLPEGDASAGLLTRVSELRLVDTLLPPDYVGDRDLAEFGYYRSGSGDLAGFYINTIAYQRDDTGNRVGERQPTGEIITVAYDADGVFPERLEYTGVVTKMQFNPRVAAISELQMSDGRVMHFRYDPLGRMQAEYLDDEEGHFQLHRYFDVSFGGDVPPSTLSAICNMAGIDESSFEGATDLESLAGVSLSRVFYDGFGNELVQVTTGPEAPSGGKRWIATKLRRYNSRFLVSEQYAPFFAPSFTYVDIPPAGLDSRKTRYGLVGIPVEIVEPTGARELAVHEPFRVLKYDPNNTPPMGEPPFPGMHAREEIFDARGRLIEVREPTGAGGTAVTSYTLASDGRLVSVSDPTGREALRYTFAGPGQAIRIEHADAGQRTYYRDAAGRLRERQDADGQRLFFSYDDRGRVSRVDVQPPGDVRRMIREFFYDADPDESDAGRNLFGRLAVVREPGCKLRFSYDHYGRLVREEQTLADGIPLAVRREFDFGGRLIAVVYPDGRRIEYTRDDAGAVLGIPELITNLDFNASGFLVHGWFDNGVTFSRVFDPTSQRLESIQVSNGLMLRELTYRYDNVGNITSLVDRMGVDVLFRNFEYDALHRLSRFEERTGTANGSVVAGGLYEYDGAGNILQNPEMTNRHYFYQDPLHTSRLTRIEGMAEPILITYDNRGNVDSFGQVDKLQFDAFDRLIEATLKDGTRVVFAYDPFNRRVLKRVENGNIIKQTRYVQAIYEAHADHTVRHVMLEKTHVAIENVSQGGAQETLFLVTDHLRSVVLVTDDAGGVVWQQRYTPFGLATVGGEAAKRYLGCDTDLELGVYQFGYRYYAPLLGRFISPDWYILENPQKAVRLPQVFNAYAYSINNPLVLKDPAGLWFGVDDLVVAAIGFVVGFVSGLVYGLQHGQGWGSLLTALEAGALGALGAWIGWNVGMLIGGPMGAVLGAVLVGTNSVMSGVHGIYAWDTWQGWAAFLTDFSWGLVGTALGGLVHIINAFWTDSNYSHDLSHEQNRHIYEGGLYLKEGFAFTQGNVISNAAKNGAGVNINFIDNHETLHIWQSRVFGPLFQATYVVWGVGGLCVASVYWLFNRDKSWTELAKEAAYYDNPFEYWAYKNDSNWPPKPDDAGLLWG